MPTSALEVGVYVLQNPRGQTNHSPPTLGAVHVISWEGCRRSLFGHQFLIPKQPVPAAA